MKEQLSRFERGRIAGLREAGWTHRRIAAHVGHTISVVCRCFKHWSVEHSHTLRLGSERPRSTDARQDRRIVRPANTVPEHHPEKKSGHMLHLLYHQGPLGTICLQQDSDHVCLWPGYHLNHDTVKYGYSGVVKESTGRVVWRSVVITDETRFCLYSSEGRTRVRRRFGERHLTECIGPRHTGSTSVFMVWRPSVTTRGDILCFCRVKYTVPATLHRLLIPWFCYCFERKVMCFLNRTAHVHIRLLRLNVLLVVYTNCPSPARSPGLSPIEHVQDMMKR